MKLLVLSLLAAAGLSAHAEPVRIHASPVLGQALISMLPVLREQEIELKIYNEASSSATIAALLNNQADVVLAVRALTGEDRAAAPDKIFTQERIGMHAVAVMVSQDVWAGGVRSLNKPKLRGIFEGTIKNWKEVGGADQPIKYYSYERGKGVWEQFATWIYGDLRKAPNPKADIIVNGEDARNTLAFNKGSIALAAPRWADHKSAFALAIDDNGVTPVALSVATLSNHRYPIARDLYAIFSSRPIGARGRFLRYLLSPAGQDTLRNNDLTPVTDLAEE